MHVSNTVHSDYEHLLDVILFVASIFVKQEGFCSHCVLEFIGIPVFACGQGLLSAVEYSWPVVFIRSC